jgi:TolB-like protein
VVIDGTIEAGARVPEKFRAVQWLRVPDGQPTAALEAVCRRLVSGASSKPPASKPLSPMAASPTAGPGKPAAHSSSRPPAEFPAFPREEPGQRVRFWFQVVGWLLQSAWAGFRRLPKWVRVGAYVWLLFVVVTRGCTSSHDDRPPPASETQGPPAVSDVQAEKLRQIAASHPGNWMPADTAQLIEQIAKEVPAAARETSSKAPLLAIPFATTSGDADARQLAGSVFTQLYGRLAISRHGRVALASEPLSSLDASAASLQGRAHQSDYVVYGRVEGKPPNEKLSINIAGVDDASVVWSKSYPVSGADPSAIAAQVSAKMSSLEDD